MRIHLGYPGAYLLSSCKEITIVTSTCQEAVSSSGSQSAGPAAGSGPDIGGSLRGILTSQTQSIIKELALFKKVCEAPQYQLANKFPSAACRVLGARVNEGQKIAHYVHV